jgi:hypothetical protein
VAIRRILPLLLAAALGFAQDTKYVQVVLRDGTRVPGKVVEEECSDETLVVRELRGDAKRVIAWDMIEEEQARQLRIELGFEVEEAGAGALAMQGHEIRNKAGVVFRGLWTNEKTSRTDGVYVLKTSEGERRIPAGDVKTGPDPVEMSQLEVYTARELYERKRKEKEPETAEDHFLLAEYAVLIDALDEAKFHYEQVLAFDDPKYTREKIERRLNHVQHVLEQAEARAALKEIQRALFANRFDRAAALAAQFKEKWGADEDLARAIAELEQKAQEERQAYFVAQVPRRVRDTLKGLLERKVKDEKDLALRAAQEYAAGEPTAEGSAAKEAMDLVGTQLGLTGEEVYAFWQKREKRNIYKGFYRDGTFAVIDNLEDALSKAPKLPKAAQGKEAPKLPPPSKPMTPEDWWKLKLQQHKYGDLRDWLYAWWAEKSGMCDVLEPKDEMCQSCIGKGYTEKMINTPQGAIPYYNRCQTCYMATFFRVVKFR